MSVTTIVSIPTLRDSWIAHSEKAIHAAMIGVMRIVYIGNGLLRIGSSILRIVACRICPQTLQTRASSCPSMDDLVDRARDVIAIADRVNAAATHVIESIQVFNVVMRGAITIDPAAVHAAADRVIITTNTIRSDTTLPAAPLTDARSALDSMVHSISAFPVEEATVPVSQAIDAFMSAYDRIVEIFADLTVMIDTHTHSDETIRLRRHVDERMQTVLAFSSRATEAIRSYAATITQTTMITARINADMRRVIVSMQEAVTERANQLNLL